MTKATQSPIQEPVRVGDLFEMVGRTRTVWSVHHLVTTPGGGALAEMHQVNGLGKVTAEVNQLHMQVLFKKVRHATY